MHGRGENSQIALAGHDSREMMTDTQRIEEPGRSLASKWTTMASAAVGAILGMPIDSSNAFSAAWVEVSQRIAALRK
jgi:hypothetical protein